MRNNPEQLFAFLQSMGGAIWKADVNMQHLSFVSDHKICILGFLPEKWKENPDFWESRIHPSDLEMVARYRRLSDSPGKIYCFEYRMISADQSIKWVKDWVALINEEEEAPYLFGVMTDTTLLKRLTEMEELEKSILLLDIKTSLRELLTSYLLGLEDMFPQMKCSIMKIKNEHLYDGLAPSLPETYLAAIENQPIGENVGSCGASAALKKQVIVTDIATDPKWIDYREVSLAHGLRACWSNPIISTEGEVMATLALYYSEPKSPSEDEIQVMERATSFLQVILENRQKTEIISDSNLLMLQSQELAHFGNWRWDIAHNIVIWSPALYSIYGLDESTFKATFEGYLELLHPDDRLRVKGIIENLMNTGEDADFEERIIRPTGEVRYLRSWAKLKKDQNGEILGMIGACLDNTEKVKSIASIELQNQQFRDIAWLQSHVVRAPLARIMGLVNLIKNIPTHEIQESDLLDHLLSSANELDDKIRAIAQKTQLADGDEG
ncbi:GAF domain-containing protein [Algoriphagus locisalis]|uniref:histidine kinase n=1 Tax=Algoriphagus locisalis TaxID=305507 RepID=A0A1I7E031_9BACT|nr:PAS domain-containing protein [Algoriphagus locisalis]SFU17266.1 GAF domain-containing protein [Algoriphagus locisalis]